MVSYKLEGIESLLRLMQGGSVPQTPPSEEMKTKFLKQKGLR